jgi:hypothetical protein
VHEGRPRLRDRHRRLPRRQQRPDFIAKAERICGVPIEILSGPREAKLSALGVVSGVHNPDGIVGDLGGGSLELIDVRGNRARSGVTLPLGTTSSPIPPSSALPMPAAPSWRLPATIVTRVSATTAPPGRWRRSPHRC